MFKQIVKNYFLQRRINGISRWVDRTFDEISKNNKSFKLSHLQSQEIVTLKSDGWSNVMPIGLPSCSFNDHSFFKTLEGFNPLYLTSGVYSPIVLRTLNPTAYYPSLQYKGLYPSIYSTMNQPRIFLRVLNGYWYDGDMNLVSHECYKLFEGIDKILIKPIGNYGGNGVQIVSTSDLGALKILLEGINGDFVCQEVVKQSELTKVFNVSSLNTFRITTLFINGRCTVTNILFRHGREGSVVDNGAAGGIMVGVDKNGKFRPYGYDKYVFRYDKSPSGIKYEGVSIDIMPEIVSYVENAHMKMVPVCGMAGWDIALNEKNQPVMLEVNLGDPGIRFEQLCSATPIFAERTQEVIDYVNANRKKLSFVTDIIGRTYL